MRTRGRQNPREDSGKRRTGGKLVEGYPCSMKQFFQASIHINRRHCPCKSLLKHDLAESRSQNRSSPVSPNDLKFKTFNEVLLSVSCLTELFSTSINCLLVKNLNLCPMHGEDMHHIRFVPKTNWQRQAKICNDKSFFMLSRAIVRVIWDG